MKENRKRKEISIPGEKNNAALSKNKKLDGVFTS
jgi:hypothetical protein